MKSIIPAVVALFSCVWSVACGASPADLIIPKPVRVAEMGGFANADSLKRISVVRQAVPGAPSAVAAEAYVLEVGTDGVRITAPDVRGERYARVTLAQLVKLSAGKVPCCTITDWPALRWRGFMNDCGRNYLEMSGVRAIIDMMAAYKMNLFHWHLSDYHGWRLESKKYPQLNAKGAFMRQVGKYYTQDEFREIVKYAGERGITVMPELDVPGHTLAFRRGMGIGTMKTPGTDRVISELFEELCSLASVEEMPFVHLGTDEVRMSAEYCDETWPTKWARTLNAAGRKAVVWAPGKMIDPSCKTVDMVWYDYHVTNTVNESFDSARMYNTAWTPFEVLRHAAFTKPCRWDIAEGRKLGAITCTWHDDNVGDDTLKLFRECMVFPSIVAMGDNYWHGRDKDEPEFFGKMPKPGTEQFARVLDLERRMLAHRDVVLAEFPHPFPFMSQTEMRWRVTDCASGTVLADELAQGTIRMNDPYEALLLPKDASIFAGGNGRVAVETWIHAPADVDCGGWIDLSGINGVYGRLRMPHTPKAGEWNAYNGKVSLNGVVLPPPAWKQPGMKSTTPSGREQDVPYSTDLLEKPMVDEMPALREPYPIHLKKGWNHVRIETDVARAGTWQSCSVTFAVFSGPVTHPRTVPGLTYSSRPPIAAGDAGIVAGQDSGSLKPITMMSFNLRVGCGLDGAWHIPEGELGHLPQCAEVIRSVNPDWVAIQEIDRGAKRTGRVDQTAALARLCGMNGTYLKKIDYDGGDYGVAVLSKEKPLSVSKILVPGSCHTRCIAILEFADYIVACTHFPLEEELRVRAAEIVCLNLAGREKPVFFAGDLNALPTSPTIAALKKSFTVLSDPSRPTFRSDKPDQCIDYIMVDSAHADCVKVTARDVIAAPQATDHCALVVKADLAVR